MEETTPDNNAVSQPVVPQVDPEGELGALPPGLPASGGVRWLVRAYEAGWALALPVMRRNARLAAGWEQRVLQTPLPAADIWIHVASGGEARLLEELLPALGRSLGRPVTVLATTNTEQGLGVLASMAGALADGTCADGGSVRLHAAYAPLDKPSLMRRALSQVRPRAVVLMEGELWPGLLLASAQARVPVLLVNGRMRERSFARLLSIRAFLRAVAPAEILAVSEPDARRLALLFEQDTGWGRVAFMPNIKFGRVRPGAAIAYVHNPLRTLLRPKATFVVLGSVRREEEGEVEQLIRELLAARPRLVIGLFPRHLNRVETWEQRLTAAGIPWVRRSMADGFAAPGSVILWDVFGELPMAYALAKAAFVGGSLAPVGGQNFLEPLAAGVATVVGPHLDNFLWAAQALKAPYGRIARDVKDVSRVLLDILSRPPARATVLCSLEEAIGPLRHGAELAAVRLAKRLGKD